MSEAATDTEVAAPPSGRTRVVDLIKKQAPPRPACFSDDESWRAWLESAHSSGVRVVRRIDPRPGNRWRKAGEYVTRYELLPTNRIDYCGECPVHHREAMQAQGRCDPCDADVAGRERLQIPTLTDEVVL